MNATLQFLLTITFYVMHPSPHRVNACLGLGNGLMLSCKSLQQLIQYALASYNIAF